VSHGAIIKGLLAKLKKLTLKELSDVHIHNAEVLHVGTSDPCDACGSIFVEQETDVLDTWFSSALWPFAILGWPIACARAKSEKRKAKNNCEALPGSDLEKYYPTQVLSTDRGIINLWVARMIFSGLEFTGQEPFSDVIVHATVLTKEGKRMSKSKGTGIDPLDLIGQYGADATRFGLIWLFMGGQDVRFGQEPVIAGKKFLNKMWNASRFVAGKTSGRVVQDFPEEAKAPENIQMQKAVMELLRTVTERLGKFEFGQALHDIYESFWHTFCDTYLEWSKGEEDEETKQTLGATLVTFLKLLHPFIPFVTETLWQELRRKDWPEYLMTAEWPEAIQNTKAQNQKQ